MPPKKKKAAPQQQAAAAAPQQKEWPVEKLVGTRERHRHLGRMYDSERLFVYAGAIMYHAARAWRVYDYGTRARLRRTADMFTQAGGRARGCEQH